MTQPLTPPILLLDDEPQVLEAQKRTLRGHYDVQAFVDPLKALEFCRHHPVSLAVVDQKMPAMLGTDFFQKLSQIQPKTKKILLSAFAEVEHLTQAINQAEIYRFLAKPWAEEEYLSVIKHAFEAYQLFESHVGLVEKLETLNKELESLVESRTQELRLANKKLEALAMTDPLTNTLNRRAFEAAISEEVDRSARYRHPLTVAMIDVDEFKAFNDMEGHLLGDEALKKIAQIMHRSIRKTDRLARYGGEEFVLLMPETPLDGGREICERLRLAVEKTCFQGAQGDAYLTLSIGVAFFPAHGETGKSLIDSADQALYQAKDQGRNQVVVKKHGSFFRPG